MKVIQICKRLNNDESGGNKNHDHFISVPPKVDLKKLLFNDHKSIDFRDKRNDDIINLTLFENRNWVKKLRPYYEKYDLHVGDEVILEKRIYDDGLEEYFIDCFKNDSIIFQKKTFYNHHTDEKFHTFEKLKGDIEVFKKKYYNSIIINSIGKFKRNKKKNTKNNKLEKEYLYECFEIIQNDENLLYKFNVNDLVEIKVVDNNVNVRLINRGTICEMEV